RAREPDQARGGARERRADPVRAAPRRPRAQPQRRAARADRRARGERGRAAAARGRAPGCARGGARGDRPRTPPHALEPQAGRQAARRLLQDAPPEDPRLRARTELASTAGGRARSESLASEFQKWRPGSASLRRSPALAHLPDGWDSPPPWIRA